MEKSIDQSPTLDSLMYEMQQLRGELHRFIERTNQVHIQSIVSGLKTEYADLISKNHIERAHDCLSYQMVHDCAMHDTCFKVFLDFLTATSSHIKEGKITGEIVEEYKDPVERDEKKRSV